MKNKTLLLVSALVLLISSSSVWSQDWEAAFMRAQEFYQAGQLDEAALEFSSVAEMLRQSKMIDQACEVMGNVGIIRIQQERFEDAISVYEEALAWPGKIPPDTLIKLTDNLLFSADKAGDQATKADGVGRLLDSKIKLDQAAKGNYLAVQGDAYRALGLYGPAIGSYKQAVAIKAYPRDKRPALLTGLGLAQGNLGQYGEALKNLELANKEALAAKDSLAIVESLSNQGILYWELGQLPRALEFLQSAQEKSREFQLRRNEGVDFNNIGAVYKTAGNWQKAIASFDSAYFIAKEVGNRRDEAIALNNRALLEKLTGHQDVARKDYEEALALYHEVQFFEGAATALMGLASLDAEEKNFPAALEKLLQAKEIYEEQALPPQIALAYIQLGLLYQKMARPDRRVTRDLVFEDIDDNEMVPIEIAPNEALAISEGYFVKAGELASKYSLTQSLWKALQGQAFAAKEKGELAKAEGLYSKAIDIVLSTKGIEDNPELLLFYLQDKEDLFQLAMEACSDLYKQTKDESLLIKQMEYDEIYRNEILKANMQMSNMEYTDPEKRSLFESLVEIDAQRKKAEKAAQTALMEMGSAKPSQAAATANDEAKVEAQRLDFEYEKYLVQWRDKYPQDRVLFDTMEKIDLKKIQQIIKNDEALIQYIPLENELDVIVITKENIEMKDLKIKYNDLYNTIIIELMGGRIENYGHSKNYYPNNYFRVETEEYNKAIEIFEELYVNIYKPIEKLVNNKKKLYFLTSKYVSYIPFAALVTGRKINNDPIFLAQSKAVALIRFSFINKLLNEQNNNKIHRNYRIISVGNPKHDKFPMADLDGAKQEAENSINIINNLYNEYEKDNKLLIEYEALKNTWIEKIRSKKFGIFYFATHGVPYAEVIYTKKWFENNIAKNSDNNNLSIDDQKDLNDKKLFVEFCNKVFTNTSHLNGFLYMAYNADENKDIELEFNTSGLLTLKDILSLDDDIFSEANLAILSACNTGVSISAKIFRNKKSKEYIDEFKSDEGIKILKDSGWVPDIDEVCLVDSFMRRNFKYVYGTLWFADDESSNYLLTAFMNNLKKYDDIIIAYNEAQKFYLDNTPVIRGNDTKLHPFFWANGNIFGY